MKATAVAPSNIALVKYWGKRRGASSRLNLPAVGSISVTLGELHTTTTVDFRDDLEHDRMALVGEDGAPIDDAAATRRASGFLDLVRERAGITARAEVLTRNNFPTGAGLASSASGFAALALAGARAARLDLTDAELSAFARQGSGSAARSIFGGFVEPIAGRQDDGSDCQAAPLAAAHEWPLTVLIAITASGPKSVGSTEGMERTAATSPFYRPWVDSHEADMAAMREAIRGRDFSALAEITERSCLKMHGLMLSAAPGLVYWNAASVAIVHAVRALRERDGHAVCFTIDAGPQVKAVCDPSAVDAVADALAAVPGVQRVIRSPLGAGARLVSDA